MARSNQASGLDYQKVIEFYLLENATKEDALEILARFIIKDVKDVTLYAMLAQKFSLSIDSKKILAVLENIISESNSVSELNKLAKALVKCGFYVEYLKEHKEIIHIKVLNALENEFNKRTPNSSNAISLLIHFKNLGIFDESSEEQKESLRKNLILLASFDLSEVAYRSLLEFAVYCKEVLKIEIPQNLIELNKRRAAASQLDSTSKTHLKIFEKLITFLSKGQGQETDWQHKFEKVSDYHYRCGNLEIIAEAEYARLYEGGSAIKKTDILIILRSKNGEIKKRLAIEVDGESHFSLVDNKLIVNGKTRARNNLLSEHFGKEDLLVIPQSDFKISLRQDEANKFFRNVRQIKEIISAAEEDLRISLEEKSDFATASAMPEEKQIEQSKQKLVLAKSVMEKESAKKKDKPKQTDDEILAHYMEIRRKEEEEIAKTPESFLLKMAKQENPDFEKIEEVLKKKSETLTVEFMRQLFKEIKPENLELFLLLFVNCGDERTTQIFSEKFLRTLSPSQQTIVKRSRARMAIKDENLVFSQNTDWINRNSTNLRNLIEKAKTDSCCYDTGIIAKCSSRFELEFMLLNGFYRQLKRIDKNRFIQFISLQDNLNLLKIVLERGIVKVEEIDADTVEILMKDAIDHQNLEMIEFLNEKGFNIRGILIKQKDNPPRSILCRAVSYGALPIIRYFIEELGYSVNTEIEIRGLKWNIMAIAASNGYSDVVKYLVSRGANYNYKDSHGLTPFDSAIYRNHIEIADYLINLPEAQSFFFSEYARQNLNQLLEESFNAMIIRNSYKSLEYMVSDFIPNRMGLKQDDISNFFNNHIFNKCQNLRINGVVAKIPNVFLDAVYEGSTETLECLIDLMFSFDQKQVSRHETDAFKHRRDILSVIMVYNEGAQYPIKNGNIKMLKSTLALNEKYKLFEVDYNQLLRIPFEKDVEPQQQKKIRDFILGKALDQKKQSEPSRVVNTSSSTQIQEKKAREDFK